MVTSPGAAESPRPSVMRRRGAVLERAILDATLEQLGTVGWNALTMEGVAAGAQTGKAAVYRRWPSKVQLVTDALRHGLPHFDHAPDQGGLREDLLALGTRLRDAMFSPPGCAVRAVLHGCDPATADRFHDVIVDGMVRPTAELVKEVVSRGIERGEVRPEAGDAFVYDMMPAMLMYRAKVHGCAWESKELEEMVDRLMLPLLWKR